MERRRSIWPHRRYNAIFGGLAAWAWYDVGMTTQTIDRFDHLANCEAYVLTVKSLEKEDYWPVSELFIQNTTKDDIADHKVICTCDCEDIW